MKSGSILLGSGRGRPVRVFVLWVVISVLTVPAGAKYGGGLGTAEHPYLIFTAEQLNAVGSEPEDWGEQFRLMADIDLAGLGSTGFHIIGTPEDGPFTGVFDGNGKTISSFRASSDYEGYLGLFGIVEDPEARIMNVVLVDPNVAGGSGRYVAALVGLLRNGTVTNCHVRAGCVAGDNFIGGLVGKSQDGRVIDCTVSATVRGIARIGGLIGQSYYGTVERCRAAGVVQGVSEPASWAVGGLVGENSNSTVTECHACCTVTGDSYVGGLTGDNPLAKIDRCTAGGMVKGSGDTGGLVGRINGGIITDSYALAEVAGGTVVGGLVGRHGPSCYCQEFERGMVARCYAAGPVRGVEGIGGLIGANDRDNYVEHSFWDIDASGCRTSAGGTGETMVQLWSLNTYLAAGWDFVDESKNGTKDIWLMRGSKGYPRLAWEPLDGDLTADGRVDLRDYNLLAEQWRRVDVIFWPTGGHIALDGVVDLDDLATLTDNWLAQLR